MQLGNAGDDGQPEAAARLVSLIQTMEATEDGFAFFDGNTRAAVGDRQADEGFFPNNPDADLTAFRRVANSIVHQVADQYAQPLGLPGDLAVRRCGEVKIDIFGQNLRSKGGADIFGQPGQIDDLRVGQA